MLKFIYFGEATLCNERINEFFSTVKDLGIKDIFETLDGTICDNVMNDNPEVLEEPLDLKENHENDSPNIKIEISNSQSENEATKYKCQECEYQANCSSNLSNHKKRKHSGLKYPCQHCDHIATLPMNLKRHIMYKHEGIKFQCQQCDTQSTTKGNLRRHVKNKH